MKKSFLRIFGIIIVGIIIIGVLRFSSPEDTRICDNGQRIMHGNPDAAMPTEACESTNVGLANPASTNCIDKGGTLEIITQANGGQVGMCTLKDGTVCEERAYMRGECGSTTNNGTPVACTEEAKLCDDGSAVGRTGPNCEFAPCPDEEPTACTMQYDPVCASVAVQCIKAPCPAIEQTFGNMCMMNANKLAKFLYKGECKTK